MKQYLYVLFWLSFGVFHSFSQCPCVPKSTCRPTAKIGLYRKLRRIAVRGQNASIQLDLEISMKDDRLEDLTVFDILKNESSIAIDWIPTSYDHAVMERSPPVFNAINYIKRDNSLSLVATFMFEEMNMLLRTTYEISIKSLYHKECKELISLKPHLSLNVTFACERVEGASCTSAVKKNHQTICGIMKSYDYYFEKHVDGRKAHVNMVLNEEKIENFERAKYLIAFFGPCEEDIYQRNEKDCIIKLSRAKRKRFCLPNRNCTRYHNDYSVSFGSLDDYRYGVRLCLVMNSFYELPPLAAISHSITAQFLFASLHGRLPFSSPMVRTIVGYTLLLFILFMFLLTILIYKCVTGRLRFRKKKKETDIWQIDENQLTVCWDQLLGTGRFGMVYLAYMKRDYLPAQGPVILDDKGRVAAKAGDYADKVSRKGIFDEIEGTKMVGRHPCIACLIGVVPLQECVLLVTEFCAYGNLKRYLTKRRKYMIELQERGIDLNGDLVNISDVDFNMVLSTRDLHRMCSQLCSAMVYLSSKALVHGALSSKHVLVTQDHSIKITDFGQTQKESCGIRWPIQEDMIRWTALEVLKGEFPTRRSDVWSFGVIAWEILTLGGHPYHNLETTAVQSALERGFRLDKPDGCSADMYQLMKQYWHHFANQRPSFSMLSVRLNAVIQAEDPSSSKFIKVNVDAEYYPNSEEEETVLSPLTASRAMELSDDDDDGTETDRQLQDASILLSESEKLLGFRS
ncbi:unnamed protein product [Auanema sp. JU1783]|nr:unnamed protein product [Auanema sp. JU1783]